MFIWDMNNIRLGASSQAYPNWICLKGTIAEQQMGGNRSIEFLTSKSFYGLPAINPFTYVFVVFVLMCLLIV
jgi:hypothetical protein